MNPSDYAAAYGDAPITGQFQGPEYNYLSSTLSSWLRGNIPGMDLMRQNALRDINTATNRNVLNTQQRLASSGLGRAGIGFSATAPIYNAQENAISNLNENLINQNTAFKERALRGLLGLNEFAGSQNLAELNSQRQYGLGIGNLMNTQAATQAQIENTPSPWMQLLGQIVGGGAQVGSAAMMASDKKLKKDIKYTGEKTKDGIPYVTYKFKDDPEGRTIKGLLAQDVQKKKPDAVFKAIDVRKVPEAIYELVES